MSRSKCSSSFLELGVETNFVHIAGHPSPWAIEEVLRRAPNVRAIQIIPSLQNEVAPTQRARCEQRGVRIIAGHYQPELAWGEDKNHSPSYGVHREFLLNLAGEQKALFEELLAFRVKEALMAARYFCLQGEDFISQRLVAEIYGNNSARANRGYASDRINSVLCYLNSPFDMGDEVKKLAETLRRKVKRLRAKAR
ncbi:hypothetical protein HY091_00530 [Candidatus Kaiserbacteria bacterium]|nr:hypothetical protein [Candidatus Kaiserbacteria bacterium]